VPDFTFGELEASQRQDAPLVLHLERLKVLRKEFASVRRGHLEEPSDTVLEAVVGVALIIH